MGFWAIFFTAHAQKRPEYYFRYQIWPRHSIRHARKPICLWNCGWKCCFKGTLSHVCTAHAQKGQNTTSGFRSDHAIRSGMIENLYSHESVAQNANLGAFWAIFLLRMRRNGHDTTSGIKSYYAMMNCFGPSTDSCGTPPGSWQVDDKVEPTRTSCVRPCM